MVTPLSITVNLPADLSQAIDRAVQAGIAKSRDELIIMALRHELEAHKPVDVIFAQKRTQLLKILADIRRRRDAPPVDPELPDRM